MRGGEGGERGKESVCGEGGGVTAGVGGGGGGLEKIFRNSLAVLFSNL